MKKFFRRHAGRLLGYSTQNSEEPCRLTAEELTVTASSSDQSLIPNSGLVLGGRGEVWSLSIVPAPNRFGSATITLKSLDADNQFATRTFRVTVLPVNDAPIAQAQFVSMLTNSPQAMTLTGTDIENDPLSYALVTQPTKGTLSGTPPHLIYTPNTGAVGEDSFTFKINDGQLDSTPAVVMIEITEAPLIRFFGSSVTTDGRVQFNLAAPGEREYVIESSGDLITWTTVMTVKNTDGNILFTDLPLPNGRRFYRAKLKP